MTRSKYRCTNMTADTLLEYLKQGATLKSWWVNGKRVHSISLPSGETLYTLRITSAIQFDGAIICLAVLRLCITCELMAK